MEHLEIFNIHKARNIVIRAPCLETLLIYSYRPLCVSVKKAPRLDKVRLSFSYSYPEFSWRLQDTMDSDEDYSFSEIEEMLDYEKMAKREHRQTDEIRNMVTFLCGLSSANKLHLSPAFPQVSWFAECLSFFVSFTEVTPNCKLKVRVIFTEMYISLQLP